MDIYVRFIGLIMLYHATSGGPYDAIIPKYLPGETMCIGQTANIVSHAAFIRVSDSQVKKKLTTWQGLPTSCDSGLGCTVYEIPDDSEITVTSDDFDPERYVTRKLPCLVPNFLTENIVDHPQLHPDALTTRSTAHMHIPAGELTAYQFDNDRVFVALHIKNRSSSANDIRVTATPRHGGPPSVLVLAPGTLVDILNMPPTHAVKDYEKPLNDDTYNEQFFFLYKLLAGSHKCQACKDTPAGSCSPRVHKGPNNLGCGDGGCC
jgi:hypothetical protein